MNKINERPEIKHIIESLKSKSINIIFSGRSF